MAKEMYSGVGGVLNFSRYAAKKRADAAKKSVPKKANAAKQVAANKAAAARLVASAKAVKARQAAAAKAAKPMVAPKKPVGGFPAGVVSAKKIPAKKIFTPQSKIAIGALASTLSGKKPLPKVQAPAKKPMVKKPKKVFQPAGSIGQKKPKKIINALSDDSDKWY